MASEKQYIDLYRNQRALLEAHSCAAINGKREAAAALLEAKGLPTKKVERYKYTNAEVAFAPDYGLNLNRTLPNNDPYRAYHCNVPNMSTSLYYVVNDVVCSSEGKVGVLPQGVIVDSINRVAAQHPELIEKYYHKAANYEYDGVTELNTLLVQDGLFVYIPAGVHLECPIQLVNVSTARGDLMSNRRVLVVAEEGAQGALLFCDHAEGAVRYLTTQVVEVFVADHAKVDLYSIEETNDRNVRFNNLYVEQQKDSHVSYNGMTLHNGLTRNRMDFRMLGEGSTVNTYGAVIADKEERVDNSIVVEHVAPSCTSDMLYKYVLDGKSEAAFAGKVLVQEGAQKSLSEQTNANLCVSPDARAYSQPMLEIYADDVKCNHGSTVGKLDESALFYMCQRGIEEKEARLLLQHAFINDVIQHVEMESLRERLANLVELRFRGELTKCKACKMCKS